MMKREGQTRRKPKKTENVKKQGNRRVRNKSTVETRTTHRPLSYQEYLITCFKDEVDIVKYIYMYVCVRLLDDIKFNNLCVCLRVCVEVTI